MLESIIIIGIYVAILEAWLYPHKEKLKASTSVKQSVSIRKKMKWIRNISMIVFLILYVVIGPIVAARIAEMDYAEYWLKSGAENGGYPPTQNGDIRSLFWLFSLMALQN